LSVVLLLYWASLDAALNVQRLIQDAEGGPLIDDAGQAFFKLLFTVDLSPSVAVALLGNEPVVKVTIQGAKRASYSQYSLA
jgi:hypothetical protein